MSGEKPFKYNNGQIIFTAKQLNRKNDVFVLILDEEIEICDTYKITCITY